MAAKPEFVVDFPTIFVAVDWIEQHCVIPDGFDAGKPFHMPDWQAWCILNTQRVRPTAKPGQLAPAFHNRRGQIVAPQKFGKGPYSAAHACLEAVGPALFDGFAQGGEVWDCRDHGCGCGWIYEYAPGEPMGKPWPTPLLQITANSEDQAENVFGALRPMITRGPLDDVITKVGEEFIRLPGGGRIDLVTSNARSRLGQRVTWVLHDESGLYTKSNGMIGVAETQRRGVAGMGGRSEETTNAWDPNEGSYAQRTEAAARQVEDIFRFHPEAPRELKYSDKRERERIHRHLYSYSPWVPLEGINAEANELMLEDPAQAERFFGNRSKSGAGKAFDHDKFDALPQHAHGIAAGRDVVGGYDPSLTQDSTGIVVIDVETGHHIVLASWTRPPELEEDDDWHVPMTEVHEAVEWMFGHWNVLRFNCDPEPTQEDIALWAGRHPRVRIGTNRHRWHEIVVNWWTNRDKEVGLAVKSWRIAIETASFSHGPATDDVPVFGDEISHEKRHKLFSQHVDNAVRKSTRIRDEVDNKFLSLIRKINPKSSLKIDLCMCAILAWDARTKVIALGALEKPQHGYATFD